MLTEHSKVTLEAKEKRFFPAKNPVDARREVVARAMVTVTLMKRAMETAARAMAAVTKRVRVRAARGMGMATKRAMARASRAMAMVTATRVAGN